MTNEIQPASAQIKQADYIVFIGRMQPPHMAHIEIVWKALQEGKKAIILFGSANQPRTITNPWTWMERADMIRACFDEEYQDRLLFGALSDVVGNTKWAKAVQDTVARIVTNDIARVETAEPSIKLIGHKKDHTSFYLEMFPQWGSISVANIDDIHATDIRKHMFELNSLPKTGNLPKSIHDYLEAFMNTSAFENLKEEYDFIKQYKKSWKVAPHEPTFVTVDAIVVQSGHVLLVRRRATPGKGLWAISGGFLNPAERIEDAMIRELREETKIKVPEPVLRGSIQASKVYDNPSRSLRGRTITHAFIIELPSGDLPKVKGSDDADKARWVPLSVFSKMEDQMFEDHFMIINDLIDKINNDS